MNRFYALALALIGAATAAAYTRATVEGSIGGTPLRWSNPDGPRFLVQADVKADLRNANGRPVISPSSAPLEALQNALAAWSLAPGSSLNLGLLQSADIGVDPFDGRNAVVFDDSPAIRAMTDGSLGVAVVTANSAGAILDADIVFNPNLRIGNNQAPYSTARELNTIDLQDAATHLLGRAVGAGVSGVVASAMFPAADPAQAFRRRLSSDDEAFLAAAYPGPNAASRRGEIFGTVRDVISGQALTGVLVTAVDSSTGVTVQTVSSLTDGTYRLSVPAVPTGRYFVYAEALDGPAIPAQFQLIDLSRFRTDARAGFFGGNAVPTRLDVPPGRSLRADIGVEVGPAALRLDRLGVDRPGGSGAPMRLAAGPVALAAGLSWDLLIEGPGIGPSVEEQDIRLFGPGIRLVEGSLRVDPQFTVRGAPVMRFTVETDSREERTLATLFVFRGRVADVFTGAIAIEPAPAFTSQQVVNAASFETGAVAPGSIVTVFGESLGPVEAAQNQSFDPATGLLPSSLAGVRATFDGIPAPLFFVSRGQINLQAPFEIAGRAETVIRVERDGFVGAPVTVPVTAASPGVFTFQDGLRAVALNQDGSVNGPDLPAFRGEVITIFATGQGVVNPALATGARATADPLRLSSPPTVTLNGVPLSSQSVLFSGLTPGLVGLLQINLRIPAGVPTGDAIALTVRFGGVESKPVRISVR